MTPYYTQPAVKEQNQLLDRRIYSILHDCHTCYRIKTKHSIPPPPLSNMISPSQPTITTTITAPLILTIHRIVAVLLPIATPISSK